MVWTSRAAKVTRDGPGAAHVQGPPVPGGAANLAAKTPVRGALATGSAIRLSRSNPAEDIGREGVVSRVDIEADQQGWRLSPSAVRIVPFAAIRTGTAQGNRYFHELYNAIAADLQAGHSHYWGPQVSQKQREWREWRFRFEKEDRDNLVANAADLKAVGESEQFLPALFCSPTMELGVDISALNAVYLRNVRLRPFGLLAKRTPRPEMEMRPVARQHLRHEVNLLHQTRGSAIDRTRYGRFGICDHASPAAFANRHKEGSRIVLTDVTAVAHGFASCRSWGVRRGVAAISNRVRRSLTAMTASVASWARAAQASPLAA